MRGWRSPGSTSRRTWCCRWSPAIPVATSPRFRRFRPSHLLCFRADPLTTQGEGRAIAHLAAVHHWHRVIVVMPTTQATRARLRVGRCYPGQVLEVAVTPPGFWAWVRGIAYEWPALMKALVLQPTC